MKKSEITGHVNDTDGEGLPGAVVTLEGLTESITRTAITNASGYYDFRGLDPGEYKVIASMTEFRTVYQEVALKIGETQRVVNFILQPD